MRDDRNRLLVDSIKRLLRRDAVAHLRKIVNKTHAADLSVVFRELSLPQQRLLFDMIGDTEQKGLLFSELEEGLFLDFIEGMEVDQLVEILDTMPTDDVADLLGRMPAETTDAILEKMKTEDSDEVEGLLSYADDTAGGIMVPDFIALREDDTAGQAVASLQKEHLDVEMPFYLYVVNDYGSLVGVCSLRQLVVVPPDRPLKSFMTREVISVQPEMDQEEVARIVARYDILAVPVVDHNNILIGIVTVDDVIDIIRMEATEDILKMAGAGEEFVETQSVIRSVRIRLPWLFASALGGIVAIYVIDHYEDTLSRLAYLAGFIPVIMGMGGNIGTQSSTIVVRGLATGRLNIRDIWTVVGKELTIGFFLGLIYGTLIGFVAQYQYALLPLGLVVCLAVISSMCIAALVGSLVPMVLARVHIDPAVATGPFVTTAIDIVSVFVYFKFATTLMGL